MSEFKVGDKVYLPALGTAVYQVKENSVFDPMFYPLKAVDSNDAVVIFAKNGRTRVGDGLPGVFHVTPENHESLEKLYGVEFEKPHAPPTNKEIIKAMLERGDKYVMCLATNLPLNYERREGGAVAIICVKEEDYKPYIADVGSCYKYAIPIDPRTGKEIMELPE